VLYDKYHIAACALPKIRAYYSRTHQPSLAVHPRAHLLQIGCPEVPINPRHFTYLPTVVLHPCRQHDSKMTAAVFCLSSSRSTARSTLYSQQMGVTSGIQTASQDFPLLSFLLGHPDMTYLLLLIITIVFSYFPGISRGPCNN